MPEMDILIPENKWVGDSSNAFRILEEYPDEVCLDFLICSDELKTAQLVSRVRISKRLLIELQNQIKIHRLKEGIGCP